MPRRSRRPLQGGYDIRNLSPLALASYNITQNELNNLVDGTLVDANGDNLDPDGCGRYWVLEEHRQDMQRIAENPDMFRRDDLIGETVAMVADQFINQPDEPWVAWSFLQGLHETTMNENAELKEEIAQLKGQLQRCERRLALFQAEAMHDVIGQVTRQTDVIPRRHLRQYFATSLQRK